MADSFGKRYAKAARLQADADLRGFAETDAAWDTSKTFLQDPDPYVRLGQVAIFWRCFAVRFARGVFPDVGRGIGRGLE